MLPAFASKMNQPDYSSPVRADSDTPPYPQNSRPYLRVISTPGLRFEDLPPPPDLSVRPPAGGPPKLPETKAGTSTVDAGPPKPAPNKPAAPAKAPDNHPAPTVATPPPILPDDAPSQVRAEDFLPYFQYPGASRRTRGADASNSIPTPPSTATYNQEQ
jgi:hypothetical protein